MALWFTRDQMHDEDSKLIQQMVGALRHIPCSLTWDSWGLHSGDKDTTAEPCTRQSGDCSEDISTLPTYFLPLVASTNMYWVSDKDGKSEGRLEVEQKSTRDLGEGEGYHEKLSGFDVRVARLSSTGLYVTPDIGILTPNHMYKEFILFCTLFSTLCWALMKSVGSDAT